ncbi:MAG: acyltransferase [Leptospiraceae bacterium]|nr:acyltransferase [Leptospiraceae bacterium]
MILIIAALRRYLMMVGMSLIPFSNMRASLLRLCGVKVGKGCYIGFNVICDTNYAEMIEIGDLVTISHNTVIFTHTATPSNSYLSKIYNQVKNVKISDGSWIGANCTILPGVVIGENCMIGAGSVVSKNTESYSLYAGNPCKKIKDIPRPIL